MVRTAGLFIFIGAVGFLNFYDDLISSDDGEDKPSNQELSKRLQKKFGAKEKRSIRELSSSDRLAGSGRRHEQNDPHLARHFEHYSEELIEYYRMPLSGVAGSHPIDCRQVANPATSGASAQCSCMRLLCFGGSSCTSGSLDTAKRRSGLRVRPSASSARDLMKAARSQQLTRCRQTTLDAFLLCECKRYSSL